MQRLAGKAAIVTGAGGGIGRQIARYFVREGASVVAVDIKAEGMAETAQQIEAEGGAGRLLALHRDIVVETNIEQTVQDCVDRFGRLDCIVNNAADLSQHTLEGMTSERWDAIMAINVKAAMWFVKAGAPYLTAQPDSSVINISSVRAHCAIPGGLAYDTSKAALLGLTRLLAVELGLRGVRVNAICPGHILSHGEAAWKARIGERRQRVGIAPYALGRLGRPEEIATVAVFLASDEASFITGQAITVDGGMSVMSTEVAAQRGADAVEGT